MNTTVLVCVAVLGLLLFGLGAAVSVTRLRSGVVCGTVPDPTNLLNKLVCAHGNTAEYAPFLAVLFIYHGAHGPTASTLAWIIAATVSRCLLVVALIALPSMARANALRFIGGAGTYVCGIALCAGLLH